ncbi:MAG: alpha-glucan family phosphorylase, partial [Alistipes sp.]|nr:alpha-glucan family phosphorylase [Alistipes sp.]
QDLIKRIVEVSKMPEFLGKIVFLQNYDMELARRMVQGVDVWLNTPTRPLEASGTSGEKCVMNGVMQFSVLDGWWVEGYKEGAGWMLPMERSYADQNFQNELDAEMIYNTIEDQIVPLYYDRGEDGIPHGWVKAVKSCVADIASNFTTNRMLIDYEERFYNKLAARKATMIENNYREAREIAAWKRKVSAAWDDVKILGVQRVELDNEAIFVDKKYLYEVTLDTANLSADDLGVELVVAKQIEAGESVKVVATKPLAIKKVDGREVTFSIDYTPARTGSFDVALRVYPKNERLPHRMDFALVKWA